MEDPAGLAEHGDKVVDVLAEGGFQAVLSVDPGRSAGRANSAVGGDGGCA